MHTPITNNYLSRFMARCKPFNTELTLWERFRKKHLGKEVRVENNKIIFNRYGTVAKFESHIEAVRVLKLAGYVIKASKGEPNGFQSADLVTILL